MVSAFRKAIFSNQATYAKVNRAPFYFRHNPRGNENLFLKVFLVDVTLPLVIKASKQALSRQV